MSNFDLNSLTYFLIRATIAPMSFPDFENAVGKELRSADQEAAIDSLREEIYQKLLMQAEQKVKQYKGLGKDRRIKQENAKILLDIIKGAKELKLSFGHTITGRFVQDEYLMTPTEDQKLERKTFSAGTPVTIHYPWGNQKEYTGNVGNETNAITLHGVVNKYGRLLHKIDREARVRAKTQS